VSSGLYLHDLQAQERTKLTALDLCEVFCRYPKVRVYVDMRKTRRDETNLNDTMSFVIIQQSFVDQTIDLNISSNQNDDVPLENERCFSNNSTTCEWQYSFEH
jgi:hypothetical protein